MRARHAALLLLGATACATPGQVRRVETQVAMMQRSQERADSARAAELSTIIRMQRNAIDSLVALANTLERVDRGSREQTAELLEARKQILAIQQRIDQSQQGLRELRAQLDARSEAAEAALADTVSKVPVGNAPSSGMPVAPVTPAAGQPTAAMLFENGRQSMLINAYGTARNAFRDLIRLYPTSTFAPEAAFGIGDAFHREGRSDSAQVAFGRVTRDYPSSMKAGSALYKLGIMAQERGDLAAARRYFEQVASPRYQAADEYELAKDRLRTLP